ncbi:MAG TPA: type 2 isopentenyl-diphosphate Delta-isomerase, partial [Microbacterium sp.]|nr:type 2 isopentenyl-diphosphate Delta-isomerase [Microbacterium sp.]
IVKEVGFGLSSGTLRRLADMGVAYADVSGNGGTDFVRVENERRPQRDYGYLEGWGQSTVACLLEAPAGAPTLLASGGVRSPLDVARALALGAHAVGVSGSFLSVVLDGGAEALRDRIQEWTMHLGSLLALLGAEDLTALRTTDVVVSGATAQFCAARGVDLTTLAQRSLGRSSNAR